MRDLNFFSASINDIKVVKKKKMTITAIFLAVVILIGGAYGAMELVALSIRTDIVALKSYINAKETAEKRNEVTEKKRRLEIMNKYLTAVSTINKDISNADIIKSQLFDDISKTFPVNISLKNLSLTSNILAIQGEAASKDSIAELHHNLKSSGLFESVFTSNINKPQADIESYDFDIQCTLKSGVKK